MTLLDRYILKEFFRIFLLNCLTLLSLFVIVSFFEVLTTALDHKASMVSIVLYLLMKMPQALYFMLPLVLLLSTILTIGLLNRSNELTVMGAAGIGIWRIIQPLLLVSLLVMAVTFFNGDKFLPYATEEMERILREDIKKKPRKSAYKKDKLWYRSDDGYLWNINLVGERAEELRGVTLYRFNGKEGLRERIDSPLVQWNGEKWIFSRGWVRKFAADGNFESEPMEKSSFDFKETPEDFVHVVKDPQKMNYGEIKEYVGKVRKEGLDPTKYLVDMESKIAFPFICIVLTMLGVPFSLRGNRQGGAAVGIAIGVAIGLTVWFVYSIGISMGRSGKIPVLAAVWGPNLFFFFVGCYLLFRSKR